MYIQSMISYHWIVLHWKNELIEWDPKNYCNISKLYVTSDNFWLPDLYIYEMTEQNSQTRVNYVEVMNDGNCSLSVPLRVVSNCDLQLYKFPFDEQACTLSFGPYLYPDPEITMLPYSDSKKVTEKSRHFYSGKGDWKFLSIEVTNNPYNWNGVNYSRVYYEISIKRSPIAYVINLILPACLLLVLDIYSMFIKSSQEERLGFKITVISGFIVLLLILNDLLPDSGNMPALGYFFCASLGIMVVSSIGSIMISHVLSQRSSSTDVPPWIKTWILKYMAYILCFKEKFHMEDIVSFVPADNEYKIEKSLNELPIRNENTQSTTTHALEVKMLKRILIEILKIRKELLIFKKTNENQSHWNSVAQVLDRLLLFLYLAAMGITFTGTVISWAT
uniref:Uncharacterized protein n=1 Tax=Xenopus tropicalis TaxID=8364 RepID=A0A6I8RJP8_XENTR